MQLITYEVNGHPKVLRTEDACRKAIASGKLTADTYVLATLADGQRQRMLARDHTVLKTMLGLDVEVEAIDPNLLTEADPAEAIVEDPIEDAIVANEPETIVAESTKTRAQSGYESAAQPEAELPSPSRVGIEPTKKEKPWLVPVIIISIILAIASNYKANQSGQDEEALPEYGEEYDEAGAAEIAAEAASGPLADLDRTSAGNFGTIRPTTIYREPNSVFVKSLGAGAKFFVKGSVGRYAYGSDEDGIEGFVSWEDINGNPFDTRKYELDFQNSTNETVYILLTFQYQGKWRYERVSIAPYTNSQVLYTDGDVAKLDSIEAYYFRAKSWDRLSNLSAATERTVNDPDSPRTQPLMTQIVPQIEGSRAIVRF